MIEPPVRVTWCRSERCPVTVQHTHDYDAYRGNRDALRPVWEGDAEFQTYFIPRKKEADEQEEEA
jgi:hypothetical protein